MILNKKSPVLVLSVLALVLILAISLTAIISDDGGNPYTFTSLRGEDVEIYGGQGLYRYDSVYKAVVIRGFDWANLVVGLPILILGTILYRRGRLRGQLVLAAVFYHFAWNYLIGVMGNGFNSLFLAYSALFSVILFGLFLVLKDLDYASLPKQLEKSFPRKSLSVYTLAAALFLLVNNGAQVVQAYLEGTPPIYLEIYTTLELAALDLAISVPLFTVGALLLWRRKAGGYVITTLFTFVGSMTFLSLGAAQSLLYFSYQRGSVSDIGVLIAFAAISICFAAIIFKRTEEK
jgi:hypothetical protein